ncbi:MAG: glycosyltransferase family 39 protein [Chloroflexota bacterium]
MALFAISIIFLFLFILSIFNLFKNFLFIEKILVFFILSCSFIVITLELTGLLRSLNNQLVILSIQAFLVLAAAALNLIYKLGLHPISFSNLKNKILTIPSLIRHNIGTFLFFCLILLTYIFLAYLQIRFPQNTTDSLYNHLSRIGHWLQQGSLFPYAGSTNIGSTFPIINSLLMMWSVIFLHSDRLVGYVQFIATIMVSLSIYSMGTEFSFSRKSNFLASLFFLSFPIILFESITAQNDILAACFLMIAFYFLIRFINSPVTMYLVISILSFSLAVGTKQYALFALPGYVVLYVYTLMKNQSKSMQILLKSTLFSIVFIICFGSYSYLQNWIYYGNPIGEKGSLENILEQSPGENYFGKLTVNSLRLSYQFLSCEGFPPSIETACIGAKTKIFTPILVSSIVNLESDAFLLDDNETFTLDKKYSLNEEASWYGMVGWLLIILAISYGLIVSVKKRKIEGVILILSSTIFFLITSSVKKGWDPYVGRYLIFSIVLLLPFAGGFLVDRRWFNKLFYGVLCTLSTFIMTYSVLNNDSRPLISQYQLLYLQRWGSENSLIIQKIAYKLTPLIRNDLDRLDMWTASDTYVKTFGDQDFRPPLEMVNLYTNENSILGILTPQGSLFPDYLFFGKTFNRKLVIFIDPEGIISDPQEIDYLLTSPDFNDLNISGYRLVVERNGWRLLQIASKK